MCTETKSGKKHAQRWTTKARIREFRNNRKTAERDRPVDLRPRLLARAASIEIIDATAVAAVPVSADPPEESTPIRAYQALSRSFTKARRREDLKELQALAT